MPILAILFFAIYNITVFKKVSSKITIKDFAILLLIPSTLFLISYYPSRLILDSNPETSFFLSKIAEASTASIFYLISYSFLYIFFRGLNEFSTIGLVNFIWVARLGGFMLLIIITTLVQFVIFFDYSFWEYLENQFFK